MTANDISIPPNNATLSDFTEGFNTDQFRLYDVMLKSWLVTCPFVKHPNTDDYQVFMASGDVGFARIKDILHKDEREYNRHRKKEIRMQFPAIAITRTGFDFDPNRYHKATIRKAHYTSEYREVQEFPYPVPYSINYQLDLFTITTTQMNLLEQWVALQFDSQILRLPVNFSQISNTVYKEDIYVHIFLESLSSSDMLETSRDHRKKRTTVSLKIEGFLVRPYNTQKTIFITSLDYYDDSTGGLLDSIEQTLYEA